MAVERSTKSAMESDIALQVGVKILIENQEGKFLLLRRSLDKYPEVDGRWDIVGGRIDPGETLIENLRREVSEETGLELTGEPKLIAAQDILRNENLHVVRLTYLGRATGDIKLDTEENDKYQWHTREDLKKLEDLDRYLKELLSHQQF